MVVEEAASIDALCDAQELVIRSVIASEATIERIYFPRQCSGIPGRAVLALVVLAHQQPQRAASRHLTKHSK